MPAHDRILRQLARKPQTTQREFAARANQLSAKLGTNTGDT